MDNFLTLPYCIGIIKATLHLALSDNMELCERNSCMRGYHIYKDVWYTVNFNVKGSLITEVIGMQLQLRRMGLGLRHLCSKICLKCFQKFPKNSA